MTFIFKVIGMLFFRVHPEVYGFNPILLDPTIIRYTSGVSGVVPRWYRDLLGYLPWISHLRCVHDISGPLGQHLYTRGVYNWCYRAYLLNRGALGSLFGFPVSFSECCRSGWMYMHVHDQILALSAWDVYPGSYR